MMASPKTVFDVEEGRVLMTTVTSPAQVTIDQLEALSRTRPLSSLEVLRLERALRRTAEKRDKWYWTKADKLRLRRHLLNGKKPALIAILMSRTERAIWQEMNRLGWTVRAAALWIIDPGAL
jgi:hypothetical protein